MSEDTIRNECWFCGQEIDDDDKIVEHIESHDLSPDEQVAGDALMSIESCDHFCCGMPENICRAKALAKALVFYRQLEFSGLLRKLDERGSTGLDLSPGDDLCRKAAEAIRLLQRRA
jgi:hypothetical protein